jgi:hypothetical protein
MDEYGLHSLVHNDAVLFEINKCMYGLPQAGLLSQQRLVAHLAEHGYMQDVHVPCLFKHSSRSTIFTLVVDDFGIKYKTLDDTEHLIKCLQLLYEIKMDKTGSRYLGFIIVFDDAEQTMSLSMPDRLYPQTPRALLP